MPHMICEDKYIYKIKVIKDQHIYYKRNSGNVYFSYPPSPSPPPLHYGPFYGVILSQSECN